MLEPGPARPRRAIALAGFLLTGGFLASRLPAADLEPEFAAREADGVVDVETETRVEIEGIEGEVVVQGEAGRAVRFRSSLLGEDGTSAAVGLFLSADAIVFRPPPGEPAQRRQILVKVPPGMAVRITTDNTRVVLIGLGGRVDVRGRALAVDARQIAGSIKLALEDGKAKLDEMGSSTEIRGRGVELQASRCEGQVYLDLSGSQVELKGSGAALEADLRQTTLVIANGAGEVHLKLAGGTAELSGRTGGAEISAEGTPVRIKRSAGGLHVETNGTATLEGNKGPLTVSLRGGTVELANHTGALTVEGSEGQLKGSGIQGPVVVKGDELKLELVGLSETLAVTTYGGELSARQVFGAVTVDSTEGVVTLQGTSAEVSVRSSGGSVRLTDLTGPLNLTASTEDVQVGWSIIPAGKESLVQNDGGNVTLQLPAGGECGVDAESTNGRVESDEAWLTVSDDGSHATGTRGGAGRHSLVVRAARDIRFGALAPP